MSHARELPDLRGVKIAALSLAREWYCVPVAWLIGLISALIYVSYPAVLWPIFDDSFISLTFAQNLADHGKLSFDGVSWSTGATSPLHVSILAALIKIGFDPIRADIFIGVISHAFLASAVYLLAWSILHNRLAGLIAALLIAFNNYAAMDAGNGLETSMFMALVAFTMASYFLGKSPGWRLTTGVLLAATVLNRPEGAFLIPALVAYRWFDRGRLEPMSVYVKDALLMAAPATIAFGMHQLYALIVSDTLGGTANAKLRFFQEDNAPLRERFGLAGDRMGLFIGPILATIGLALLSERRREFVLFGLFWLPVVVLYILKFPGGLDHYFYRYQHPVLPLLAVLAASGAIQAMAWGMRSGVAQKAVVIAVFLVVGLATEQHYERWRVSIYNQAAFETRADLSGMAQDLNRIVKPDETLAAHDIGAVGYFANYEVLDLVGLVNPAVLPYQEDRRVKEYLEMARPDYILLFAEWDFFFLHIFPGDDARFTLVKEYPGGPIRQTPYLLYKVNWNGTQTMSAVGAAPATP
jgi:hypothetical protein